VRRRGGDGGQARGARGVACAGAGARAERALLGKGPTAWPRNRADGLAAERCCDVCPCASRCSSPLCMVMQHCAT